MTIDNLMVTLNRLPPLRVDTGTDWVTLFGFLVTVIAVVTAAWYNSYTFKINAQAYQKQSKSEFLAKSRLEWIALFREHVSAFLAQGEGVYEAAKAMRIEGLVANDAVCQKPGEFADQLAKARLHLAQIELLVSPNSSDSPALVEAMNEYLAAAVQHEEISAKGQVLVNMTQRVLAREWDKVKEMSDF